ncbi:hypothetical protein KUW09_25050 [Mameliella alba]|nr:hypothetical protein [Antarctobacter heliothermus]MBY6147331.1 hypothetical protein [Mameliella alba]MCA0957391.1 hypothetical protein [Mameliella alba]
MAEMQKNSEQVATQIHLELLDRTGNALMNGDFDGFLSCFLLPLTLSTQGGPTRISDENDFLPIFEGNWRRIQHLNVTEYSRACVSACFIDDKTIYAVHETRLLSGHALVRPAVPAFSILKKVESVWKVWDQEYAIGSIEELRNDIGVVPAGLRRASASAA